MSERQLDLKTSKTMSLISDLTPNQSNTVATPAITAGPTLPPASGATITTLPALLLPKRFEVLEQESEKAGVSLNSIIHKVDDAAARIETLLRLIRDGGTGVFEVFFGKSGAGKTTFLRTLPKFFEGVKVIPIPATTPLAEITAIVRSEHVSAGSNYRIYVIHDRDNDPISASNAEEFFEDIRRLFRTQEGRVLIVWPVTRSATRDVLTTTAWAIGSDSICSSDTRGSFEFSGLPKSIYYEVASMTVANLKGDQLEAFGITKEGATNFLPDVETIGAFYSRIEREVSAKRDKVWQVLKAKVHAHVWIVVAGDDASYVYNTVGRLTQGRRSRIDLELMNEFLDDKSNEAVYLAKWRERRSDIGFLMRTLDVRIIALPPTPILASVRVYGSNALKGNLKKQNENLETAIDAIARSRLFKALVEEMTGTADVFTEGRPPGKETEDEFIRVQRTAAVDDKPLNRALGAGMTEALKRAGLTPKIISEKRNLPGTNLQPDIQFWLNEAEVVCVEPTWRTSGRGIGKEIVSSQNSMSPGHIQKYLLAKVYDYVISLGL